MVGAWARELDRQQHATWTWSAPQLAAATGVEMEGGGVAAGLHDDIERPRFLMIRGCPTWPTGRATLR
jgi:hypothetical protein